MRAHEVTTAEQSEDGICDGRRLRHAAQAVVTRSYLAVYGPNELHATIGFDGADVPLGRWVTPHARMHRRRRQHRTPRAQRSGSHQISDPTLGQRRQQVGRGRHQRHDISPGGELDMQLPRDGLGEHVAVHRLATDPRERGRSDKTPSCLGHHGSHPHAAFDQQPGQLHSLVGGDAP